LTLMIPWKLLKRWIVDKQSCAPHFESFLLVDVETGKTFDGFSRALQ